MDKCNLTFENFVGLFIGILALTMIILATINLIKEKPKQIALDKYCVSIGYEEGFYDGNKLEDSINIYCVRNEFSREQGNVLVKHYVLYSEILRS